MGRAHKGAELRLKQTALNENTAQGIRAVQDNDLPRQLRGGLQGVKERLHVSVKPAAHILEIRR